MNKEILKSNPICNNFKKNKTLSIKFNEGGEIFVHNRLQNTSKRN
jgi:hypothetical protein